MKLQAITLIAVLSVAFTSNSADAGHPSFGGGSNGSQQNWNPGYGGGSHCVQPPVCSTPVRHTPVYAPQPPVRHTPVWTPQRPVCSTPGYGTPVNHAPAVSLLTLLNNSGQTFDFRLNRTDVDNMLVNGQKKYQTTARQGASRQPVTIEFHNGQQVVDVQLDPTATYLFTMDAQTQKMSHQ